MNRLLIPIFVFILTCDTNSIGFAQTRMIENATGNPIRANGTWDFEVLLTSPDVILDSTLTKSEMASIYDLISLHQKKRQNLESQIPSEFSIARRDFEKWIIEEELQGQLSLRVGKTLSAELIQKMQKNVIDSFLKDRFVSEIVLQDQISERLELSEVQRARISELDRGIKKKFLASTKQQWIKQFKELFKTLNEEQRTKINSLVGDFSKLKSIKNEGWISRYRVLNQSIGWSPLNYEPFELSYVRYLTNKKIVAELGLTSNQAKQISELSRDHFRKSRELIDGANFGELKVAKQKFEEGISQVLIPHQLQILQKEICQKLLPWVTPLKFLDVSIVKNELGIDATQRKKLAKDFSEIHKQNREELEEIKKRLEKQVVNLLSKSQRKILDEIIQR